MRQIRTWHDAEQAAAAWLREHGWSDATVVGGGGPDGGVDIRGQGLVAQVKAETAATGRPVLQQLSGVAAAEDATPILFTLAGLTPTAESWAEQTGLAVYQFDLAAGMQPVNSAARRLLLAGAESLGSRSAVIASILDWLQANGWTDAQVAAVDDDHDLAAEGLIAHVWTDSEPVEHRYDGATVWTSCFRRRRAG